jgi:polyisoprenoid-binding protein YceI
MKNLSLTVALAIAVTLSAFTFLKEKAKPVVYTVDTKQSSLSWIGYKVGGKHNGDVKLADGTINVDGKKITGGVFNIDMTSITDKDIEGEWNGKLVGHLKNEDFFNVAKFPTSKFEISKIVPNTKATGKDNYDVTGKLTIKGITKDVTFPATVKIEGSKLTANGNFKLDRTKWDITYRSDLIGTAADKIINNEFEIGLNLVATSAAVK